ncbi:hypothetical protein ASPZODRAFT_77436 [Penicilliopsis zonata CBS 506.65]|uniref:DUF6987 domain-containing protein n=1 Tax=Penicilliopsis zonata CBS 506.65 TaxID=1073090 RepID=A0A1L9S501_9EURO|nr:hypothetical protein ASPZODRAFT_77436 [Penicilliopsis zonata CBS 506.65]OJJ42231.1 hypothetical protein ASPZODRAFT_77436 [Penicilliopsis zonata CBS 506.65]
MAQETLKKAQRSITTTTKTARKTDSGTSQAKETAVPSTETLETGGEKIPLDLAQLEGLEVQEGGKIMDSDGRVVGRLVEGDPADLEGEKIGSNGEILDEDGDLIGRVEGLPTDELPQEAISSDVPEAEGVPGLGLKDLAGLPVTAQGHIKDDDGRVVGKLVEGDAEDLIGETVNEQGEILDDDGDLVGRIELTVPEGDILKHRVPGKAELDDVTAATIPGDSISALEGLHCNKLGYIVTAAGKPMGRLIEGDAKQISREGLRLEGDGCFRDSQGNVLGSVEPLRVRGEEGEEEEWINKGPFADLGDIFVAQEGWVHDVDGQRVGRLIEGDAKRLLGHAVDDDGDILDKHGNLLGRAEPWEEPSPTSSPAGDDALAELEGLAPNKTGNVMGPGLVPIARVVDGNPAELLGRRIDSKGQIWNDTGAVIGHVELIPAAEREAMGPFSGLGDLVARGTGAVEDAEGILVGRIVEGNPKGLRGRPVDADGEILDQYGNVLGRAERCDSADEEEAVEEEEEDLSALDGLVVNKLGNIVDADGVVVGRLVAGDPRRLAGKTVDGDGHVWNASGQVIGQAEGIPEAERDRPEGIFSGLDGLTLQKDGMVLDPAAAVVGRLVEGDAARLAGRAVDEDGEIIDKAGNVIGRAERWTPEELQREINPMSGRAVNKDGHVRDEDGNILGKLTQGNLQTLVGKRVDEDGYIVDQRGNTIGECTLMANLPPEPVPEPALSPEELAKQEQEQAAEEKAEEERSLAKKMSSIVQGTLESVGPLCRQIRQHIETAERTPKDELDEEQLVKEVQPLIEEAGDALQECKGALRALDPDGQIAATAKGRSAAQEATPEEHRLAELLKELAQTVVETIEEGRRLLADMPHAKQKINPLWALLSEPLFQIMAAVGLLLSGVVGLVSQLLDGLGLGGLLRGLLGGLGLDKLLEGLGLGTVTQALGITGK